MTGGNTLLGEDGRAGAITLQDRLPGLNNEFGGGGLMEDGFGMGDGGMMDLGDFPNVSDLTLDKQASRAVDSKERGVYAACCVSLQTECYHIYI